MAAVSYEALIRTFNSEKTLAATLSSLEKQGLPPSRYVFVDSGSTDATLSRVPPNSVVHRYVGDTFNYSASLNQGLDHIDADYVLVISSHTALLNVEAMQYALDLLESEPTLAAAYFPPDSTGALAWKAIGPSNFTGFNGVFNTCGVYRMSLLRQRRFRPEVPSAEDQEWSRWLFDQTGLSVARISGGLMRYDNPKGYGFEKRWGEYVSVAFYAKPEFRRLPNIARVAYWVVKIHPWQPLSDRSFHLRFLGFLLRNIDQSHWW